MLAVVYARISRDRTGAGLGVERQRDDCAALAEQLGWTVVEIFEDNDISAFSGKKRPGYDAMCEALESGRADGLIVWHTDRLHRRPAELETFIDLCERRKIEVRTVKSGTLDLSTPAGRMVARMLGATARHEVEHSIERQKRAKHQAALEGKYRGGRRAFGYESDGVTLRQTEADAIREGTKKILSGVSLRQVTREWNESGLRTSRGNNEFHAREVKKILLRHRNAGIVLHEGKDIGDGLWEPIIGRDDFTALESILRDPERQKYMSFERKWMGSGVYVCGKCGKRMLTATKIHGTSPTYICEGGAHIGRVADSLDRYVESLVLDRLSRPDARIVLGTDKGNDIHLLKTRERALEAKLITIMDMYSSDELTASQMKKGTADIKIDLEAVQNEIANARKQSVLANLILAGQDLETAWNSCTPDVRGKIVDALMTVTILPAPRGRRPGGHYFDPKFIRIEWKASDELA